MCLNSIRRGLQTKNPHISVGISVPDKEQFSKHFFDDLKVLEDLFESLFHEMK